MNSTRNFKNLKEDIPKLFCCGFVPPPPFFSMYTSLEYFSCLIDLVKIVDRSKNLSEQLFRILLHGGKDDTKRHFEILKNNVNRKLMYIHHN